LTHALILAVFCPEMPCEVRITDNARQDFLGLDARWHSAVKAAVEAHLRLGPATMIRVPLATVKDDLSGYVRKSAQDEVLITRHGKPAALLIGFADEDEWFDYRLEHDERFLQRMAESREQARRGKYTPLDDLPDK
jgi:prevent-host-death family protein